MVNTDLNSLNVVVDFERLHRTRQTYAQTYKFEEVLGNFLRLLSISIAVLIIVLEFGKGRLVFLELLGGELDSANFMLVLLFPVYAYGLYLTRDKNKYQSNREHLTLRELKLLLPRQSLLAQRLEADDYFDAELMQLLAEALSGSQPKVESKLLEQLLQAPSCKQLLERLNLSDKVAELLKKAEPKFRMHNSPLANLELNLRRAFQLALALDAEYVSAEQLLICYLENDLAEFLASAGVATADLKAYKQWLQLQIAAEKSLEAALQQAAYTPWYWPNFATPQLEKFSTDLNTTLLTQLVKHPTVRLSLQLAVVQNLAAELTSSDFVLLKGPVGVGKSTIIDTLVLEVLAGQFPELKGQRFAKLDLPKLLRVATNAGELATTLQRLVREGEQRGTTVLVIDDLEELLAARAELRPEIVAALSEQLEPGRVKILAATSADSYQVWTRELPELLSKFQIVDVPEPSPELTVQMLLDETVQLRAKYRLTISVAAVRKLVELSQGVDMLKVFPDKALDQLRGCCEFAVKQGLKFISPQLVEQYFSGKIGVTTKQSDFLDLEKLLNSKVIGQQAAVTEVSAHLRRAKTGLGASNKPLASFLFYGPTGVGKTYLAQALSQVYFGNPQLFLRLDMSEYQEDRNLGRLLGEVNSGKFQPGILSNFVLEHPYSVVLLDELEKANPKVLDIFLQVLDNGSLSDGAGREIDFRHTIIVATSNAGANLIASLTGQAKSYKEIQPKAYERLLSYFRVEFLNRFDAVLMFQPLTKIDADQIARLLLVAERHALAEKGIEFVFDEELVQTIVETGYDAKSGARGIKRAIQIQVEDKIAQAILSGKLRSGDVFKL
jgi:ATP-dependent Clp protease ATP-binding subunit ClpC